VGDYLKFDFIDGGVWGFVFDGDRSGVARQLLEALLESRCAGVASIAEEGVPAIFMSGMRRVQAVPTRAGRAWMPRSLLPFVA
jgi:hypothetical protein